MPDLVARFQDLISGLACSQSQESDVLLRQLNPADAKRLRLCAIPHTFDAAVLQVLDPDLGGPAAATAMRDFEHLAAVVQLPGCLALHDVVRRQLFTQWLLPEHREEFSAASRRLSTHFQPQASDTSMARSTKERSSVFHLVGADMEEGFRRFQQLYREHREQFRPGECEILVRLVHEYDVVLNETLQMWLSYYDAELAADTRDWRRAADLLTSLLTRGVESRLYALSQLTLGYVLRQMRDFDSAEAACRSALKLATELNSEDVPIHSIEYQLGLIARDRGRVDAARTWLEKAIRSATAADKRMGVIAAGNSLGTLLFRIAPQEAIDLFERCLDQLSPERDGLLFARVVNNLATVYADIGEWEKSQFRYQQSLDIKRAAADSHDQASTLFNIARVYQAQKKLDEADRALREAASLFEMTQDLTNAARAYRELARLWFAAEAPDDGDLFLSKALNLYELADAKDEGRATRREFKTWLTGAGPGPGASWVVLLVGIIVVLMMMLVMAAFELK